MLDLVQPVAFVRERGLFGAAVVVVEASLHQWENALLESPVAFRVQQLLHT